MRLAFVRPNLRPVRSWDAMQPLALAILQGLTPPDVETVLHDERLAPIPFDEPVDLAAITVETYTARRAYEIAAEYRRRGARVVLGGFHPTFAPEEAAGHADAVVVGDAEGVWPQVVADARAGRLQRLYRQVALPPLAGLWPDRRLFAGRRYAPIELVQYGRGCRFACEFCSIHAAYGTSLRQRPVREVVAEIERLDRRHVFLVDDNIFVDVPRARELFEALVPLRIRWSCQVSIDVARDPSLVALMARSGALTAVVGFESLDAGNLRQMRKGWNLRGGPYDDSIRVLQDAGLMIYGTFVFGYDRDTPDAFDRAVEFALRHRFYLANFNPLTPMPGSALFERLLRQRQLLHPRWWLQPGYRYGQATFRPQAMSPDELTEGCWRARSSFNSYASIARRALDARTHLASPYRLGLYLASNLVSRREVRSKQGAPLGAAPPAAEAAP